MPSGGQGFLTFASTTGGGADEPSEVRRGVTCDNARADT
jgi:hypothetical protein